MLPAMQLYRGLRAAPGSARRCSPAVAALACALCAWLTVTVSLLGPRAQAQPAPPASEQDVPPEPESTPAQPAALPDDALPRGMPDVLRAPPPEPPDDSDLPVVPPKTATPADSKLKPSAAKRAPTPETKKPQPASAARRRVVLAQADATPERRAPEAVPPQKSSDPPPAAETPSLPSEPSAPVAPAAPEDSDFGGRGEGRATAPQEDFESEVQEESRSWKREYSARIDTLNWLLLGRLSVELEVSVWKYLSVTVTPIFVTHTAPIAINYAGLDDPLKQHSNGLGPISGVSAGVGAWFWGEPFRGYVLRLELSNYGYTYRTKDSAGTIDSVDFTERRVSLFIGSHSRFGPFTFAGGFGLGYELHQVERCGLSRSSDDASIRARDGDCRGQQQIALDRSLDEHADLNGPLHPVYFQARFSLGVVF